MSLFRAFWLLPLLVPWENDGKPSNLTCILFLNGFQSTLKRPTTLQYIVFHWLKIGHAMIRVTESHDIVSIQIHIPLNPKLGCGTVPLNTWKKVSCFPSLFRREGSNVCVWGLLKFGMNLLLIPDEPNARWSGIWRMPWIVSRLAKYGPDGSYKFGRRLEGVGVWAGAGGVSSWGWFKVGNLASRTRFFSSQTGCWDGGSFEVKMPVASLNSKVARTRRSKDYTKAVN